MIEKLPLEKAPEAYARMIEGKARFRMVLVVVNILMNTLLKLAIEEFRRLKR